MKDQTENLHLTDEPLQVEQLSNAFSSRFNVIQAEQMTTAIARSEVHCKAFTTGCLYNKHGKKNRLSERLGGFSGDVISLHNADALPRPSIFSSEKLQGNTFYLGVWMGHYGHFITETLSRLWAFREIKHFRHLVVFPFIFSHRKPVKDYQAYLMYLLDIPSDNIETLRAPTRFKSITVPEQGWTINRSANSNIAPIYTHIRETHQARHSSKETCERIFLSRNDKKYQRTNNVADIETLFKKRGFTIFYPDQLTMQQQLSIYSNCKIMAGFSGSALHNCLFTHQDTLVIEVADMRTGNKFHPMQKAALELSGNPSQLIHYQGDQGRNFNLEFLADELATILLRI